MSKTADAQEHPLTLREAVTEALRNADAGILNSDNNLPQEYEEMMLIYITAPSVAVRETIMMMVDSHEALAAI